MKLSRRVFFSRVTGALAVGALVKSLPVSVLAQERRRGRPAEGKATGAKEELSWPLVDPKAPMAKGVSYVEDKAQIKDAKLKTERQGVTFDKQFCDNCSFYKEVGKKDGKTVGTCTIFAKQIVLDKAWCQTWNKKV